ncbi:hypothetical protein FM103_02205 [Corynebacterium xerosis]|nr:hypothetical protein FM103_02205 [Corynebacterium xerosis]
MITTIVEIPFVCRPMVLQVSALRHHCAAHYAEWRQDISNTFVMR